MAYLGLSPDYPDQYFTSPGEPLTCGDYCATMKTEFYSMRYLARPEGCICPGEVDAKKQGFPVTKPGAGAMRQRFNMGLMAVTVIVIFSRLDSGSFQGSASTWTFLPLPLFFSRNKTWQPAIL